VQCRPVGDNELCSLTYRWSAASLDRGCEVSSMREVSRQQVQDLMEKGAQVVDVLPAEEF
jgi:hypothetical protein